MRLCLYFSCKRSNIGLKQTAEMEEAVATEFGTTRDGIGHSIPLPPPGEISEFDPTRNPERQRSGFFVVRNFIKDKGGDDYSARRIV